jgi:hypothetical protein
VAIAAERLLVKVARPHAVGGYVPIIATVRGCSVTLATPVGLEAADLSVGILSTTSMLTTRR